MQTQKTKGGLVNVGRVLHAEGIQREGQAIGDGYDPNGVQEDLDPTASAAESTRVNNYRETIDRAGGTASDAPHSALGLIGGSSNRTHHATSQRHPREGEEQRVENTTYHGTAQRREPCAEESVAQRGFANSHHRENENQRENRGRQARPHSEGGAGFRGEDRGGASEGWKRRSPRKSVGGSISRVVQRDQSAGTNFSQQQQQERKGEPRGAGSASSERRQENPQHYQRSSELSDGDAGRMVSSSPPRGEMERGGGGRGGRGERGDGGEGGWAASTSAGPRTTPTPRASLSDANSRDVNSLSSDRVGDSRGLSSRDRSPPPRTPEASIDMVGVIGSPSRGRGGDRALDLQAIARQGQYGPGRGGTGVEVTTSSVAAPDRRRRGGGEGGGFRAGRGNEPVSARTERGEQIWSRGDTTPSYPDDVGYSKNSSQRNNATPVGGGRAAWGGPAAANAPSATGLSGHQGRRDGNTEGGGGNVDAANNGKFKGGLSRSGSPPPEGSTTTTTTTSAPTTTTLKSVQDRRKIQHMAKTMSEVAIAAAGGAADTSPDKTADGSDNEREPRKAALTASAAEARGGDRKAGAAEAGKGMTDRQERALRAFLKGVRSYLPRQAKTT